MISGQDFYHVLSALVPLYVAMGLAYASVRWWKIFTPDQCAGINRFVAVFAVPFLSFTFVSSNNFYHMNYRFIAADSLQKILICNSPFFPSRRLRRIDCVITLFSLSTLPNTLVVGVPLLAAILNLELPSIVENSVSILANTGLGMAMFSLGLFIGVQPKVIGCGKWMALMAMSARFLLGPGVAAAAAGVVGVRGILLQVTIVQAALPQGIIPFVYAKDYNLYPEILSTAVIFGMVVALPVTIIYYVLLGL
ncbi:Probable auxin efflux carrier component 8 [Linum perenne]